MKDFIDVMLNYVYIFKILKYTFISIIYNKISFLFFL